jgi:hypothetical protein
VQLNSVTTEVLGTTIVPVGTGPTGGFGSGSGSLNIASMTDGTLMVVGPGDALGTGSSVGTGTNFGGGSAIASNYFGSAGGVGSGEATSGGTATGTTKEDTTNGIFTGTAGAVVSFNNDGTGIFGSAPSPRPFGFSFP